MADTVGNLFGTALGAGEKVLGGVGNAIGSGLGEVGHLVGSGLSGLGHLFGLGGGVPAASAAGSVASPASAVASAAPAVGAASAAAPAGLGTIGDIGGGIDPTLGAALSSQPISLVGQLSSPTVENLSSALPQVGAISPPQGGISSLLHSVLSPGASGSGGGASSFGKYLIPALLLGGSLMRANSAPPAQATLEQLAQQQLGQGTNLQGNAIQELLTGNLPGPAQASIDQALADAESTIRSNYSSMNLGGSSMEAQDLARAKENAVMQKWQLAQSLAKQGLDAASGLTGQASNLYQAILQTQLGQDQSFSDALAGFAGSLVSPKISLI